jgi:hypothetical protein
LLYYKEKWEKKEKKEGEAVFSMIPVGTHVGIIMMNDLYVCVCTVLMKKSTPGN